MDLNQLREILDLVKAHELSEFEVEHEGLKLKIRRNAAGVPVVTMPALTTPAGAVPVPAAAGAVVPGGIAAAVPTGAAGTAAANAEAAEAGDVELAVVKSPIVGTFYRSPEPGAPPFVDIGSQVKKGQVLCIIEAMKLMNEIDSEYDGEIANVYVESGQPVQYGERLFTIKTR
jgi:acetyl-CoA carboxylase biotin carboxyl carrier protein